MPYNKPTISTVGVVWPSSETAKHLVVQYVSKANFLSQLQHFTAYGSCTKFCIFMNNQQQQSNDKQMIWDFLTCSISLNNIYDPIIAFAFNNIPNIYVQNSSYIIQLLIYIIFFFSNLISILHPVWLYYIVALVVKYAHWIKINSRAQHQF